MTNRPPSTYRIVVTAAGAGGSTDTANFTLAASGESAVPGAIGAQLHLQGIDFGVGADGTFAYTPSVVPPGVSMPITETVAAQSFLAHVPGSIHGATTSSFPFVLCYGPLGLGAR